MSHKRLPATNKHHRIKGTEIETSPDLPTTSMKKLANWTVRIASAISSIFPSSTWNLGMNHSLPNSFQFAWKPNNCGKNKPSLVKT